VATKRLPHNPDLEQYRCQAKDLRKALAAREPLALERLRQFHPQGALSRPAKLADAQLVLAREHGFASWPLFAAEVQAQQADGWPAAVTCDAGSLAVEVSAAETATSVVVFVLAGNVGRQHLGIRQIADRLRRARHATVLADLLTPEEARQDAIDEALRFDLPLLSERAGLVLGRIRADPALSDLPLALFCAGTGGAAGATLAARRPEAVRAMVSLAGRPDLAGSALARVRAPSLFIVGSEDAVAHGFTRMMLEIFPRDVASRLEVVRGVGLRFEEGPAAARAAELAIRWLGAHVQPAEQAA
jgi:pimeloyl-ACP methyl ester carboxylesterase